jgi:hypothetical protein
MAPRRRLRSPQLDSCGGGSLGGGDIALALAPLPPQPFLGRHPEWPVFNSAGRLLLRRLEEPFLSVLFLRGGLLRHLLLSASNPLLPLGSKRLSEG